MTQYTDLKGNTQKAVKQLTAERDTIANGADPLGATNLSDRVNQILALTGELSTLLEAENEILKQRQIASITANEAKKSKLSRLYAQEMRAIAARPELLAGITNQQRSALKTAAGKFRDLTADHARRLARAKAVTEGLVKAIGDEVAKTQQSSKGYRGPGQMNATPAYSRPAALSLDQSV